MDNIDLHVHSTYSDGTMTPAELIQYAEQKGLSAIALTDHDTIQGLEEGLAAAKNSRVELVPGIEMSVLYGKTDVHIVGLFVDHTNPEFIEIVNSYQNARDWRNETMVEKIREQGFPITLEEMMEAFPDAVITRAHFSRYLLEHGYVASIEEAFTNYLGEGCPCYVQKQFIAPEESFHMIYKAGGVPVLAHPILYHLPDPELEAMVSYMKEIGLMGIEVMYSTYKKSDERKIRNLAKKYDLLVSGGSDFHGSNKPHIDLGSGLGNLKVPGVYLDDLRLAHHKVMGRSIQKGLVI